MGGTDPTQRSPQEGDSSWGASALSRAARLRKNIHPGKLKQAAALQIPRGRAPASEEEGLENKMQQANNQEELLYPLHQNKTVS